MYLISIVTSNGIKAEFKSLESRHNYSTSNVNREHIVGIKGWHIEQSIYKLFSFSVRIDEISGDSVKCVDWWDAKALRSLYDRDLTLK